MKLRAPLVHLRTRKASSLQSRTAASLAVLAQCGALTLAGAVGAHAAQPGTVLPPGMVPQLRGVVSGAAVGVPVPTPTGNLLTINQTASRAIIDWNTFNIGSGSEVRFAQPGATAVALNRIFDADPSIIQGRLTANGQVYLLNRNGIFFDRGAQIDANTFLASTLNITQERFLSGIASRSAADGPAFSGANGNSPIGVGLFGPDGAPPPTITTQPGGTIMMFAPQVTNNGILRAPDGQVILAAGNSVLLSFGQDYSLRGFLVQVTAANGPVNLTSAVANLAAGDISADRGNVTLAGLVVNQAGRISASSAALNNGSIYLTARAGNRTGSVTLAPGSVTETPIDKVDRTTLTDDQPFQYRPTVQVQGGMIVHEGRITAPSGQVSLTSSGTDTASGLSRVYLGPTASIDASGLWTEIPASKGLVQIKLNSDVLADAPAQKGGFLQGRTIMVDPRLGKPSFVAAAPYAATLGAVPRSVAEKAAEGGSIELRANTGDVIVRQGAVVNVSGGGWMYDGGVSSSVLVASDRSLWNVSSAPADRQYIGQLDSYTRRYEKWGITEQFTGLLQPLRTRTGGDFEGRSAGSLTIAGRNAAFDGRLLRDVRTGPSQLAPDRLPSGATLRIGDFIQPPTGAPELFLRRATVGDAAPLAGDFTAHTPLATTGMVIDRSLVDGSGSGVTATDRLGTVSIIARESVSVADGAEIRVRENGSIALQSNNVDVGGRLVAPGGAIRLTGVSPQGVPAAARVTLRSGAVATAAGSWVNDATAASGPGLPVPTARDVDGGAVTLAAQRVELQAGSLVDVTGGAWLASSGNGRTLRTGNAGVVEITGPVLDDSTAVLNGSVLAHGYASGGQLSVAMSRVRIGDVPARAGETVVTSGWLGASGASAVSVQSTGAAQPLEVARGSAVRITPDVRVIDPLASAASPSGTPIAAVSTLAAPDPTAVQASSLALNALGTVGIARDASVTVNPGGSVTAGSLASIDVQGAVRAPGGSITLTMTPPAGQGAFGGGSIALGGSSLLDVSGVALTRTDDLGRVLGSVLNAGTITLSTRKHYIDIAPTATLDLRGAAARVDTLGLAPGLLRTGESLVSASNAGTLRLTTTEAARTGGNVLATPGGPTAAGGTYVLELSQSGDPTFANARVVRLGDPRTATFSPDTPTVNVDLPALQGAGFDKVVLRAQDRLDLAGGANVSLGRSLVVDAGAINATDNARYAFAAPQVTLASTFPLNQPGVDPLLRPPQQTRPGGGTLAVSGGTIDLVGPLTVNGVASVSLATDGDVRLTGRAEKDQGNATSFADRYRGTLVSAGDITIAAAQVYPTTLSDFSIGVKNVNTQVGGSGSSATRPGGRITITQTASPSAPVLSAGGRLTLEAAEIIQGGTLKAPLGDIVLAATDRVQLAPGSATSVSAQDLTVPFGTTASGITWNYGALAALTTPPDKDIRISAPDIRIAPGATLDLSGGGALQAAEFVPGSGGSADTLLRSGTFAILPASQLRGAPVDNDLSTLSDLGLGPLSRRFSTVYDTIHIGPGSAVPAGDYALLPGYYALLPGAYVVRRQSGSLYQDMQSGASVRLADGTTVVSGYLSAAGTAVRESRTSGFQVLSAAQARRESEYRLTGAQFFADLAQLNDRVTPRLPDDAGRLALAATSRLDLQGNYATAANGGGRIADVDITAPRIAIVDATGAPGFDPGVLQIAAGDLSRLNASLLVGGTRAETRADARTVTQVVTGTGQIVLANSAAAPLRGPETILMANDAVQVRPGAVLGASGDAVPGRQLAATGDGAVVAVSTGPALTISRAGPAPAGVRGDVTIGTGSNVYGQGALLVDATRNATLNATPAVGAGGAVALGAGAISVGEAPAGAPGLVLSTAALNQLAQGGSLTLRARQAVDFYGTVTADLRGTDLILDTPLVRGRGEAGTPRVALTLGDATLLNTAGGSASAGPIGTGQIALTADTLTFGAGDRTVRGFADGRLAASEVRLDGTGATTFEGALTLAAGRVSANSAGTQSITAAAGSTWFPLALAAAPATANASPSAPAATLALGGRSVAVDTAVALPSGNLNIAARGTGAGDGIDVGANAAIDLAGVDIPFRAGTVGTPGGTLNATAAAGSIALSPGARVSVAGAPSGGDAGAINLRAARTVSVAASLDARAVPAATAGSARVDAGSIADFSGLNATLEAGGFAGSRDIRTRTGDLVVAAADRVTARDIVLSADAGRVDIAGTLDATRPAGGGSIDVSAGAGVNVRDGAALLANATAQDAATYAPGGRIRLATSSGNVTFAAGALADVSAGRIGDAGEVTFIVPRSAAGELAATLRGRVRGAAASGYEAGRVVVEGHRAYTVDTLDPGIGTDHYAEYAAFMGPGNAAARNAAIAGLQASGTQAPVVRAGIELRAPGDLSLDTPWDLTAPEWLIGGQPGTLTLRAGGTLTLAAPLGFPDVYGQYGLADNVALLGTQRTWNLRAVGGADLSAARPTRVVPGASAGDVVMASQFGFDADFNPVITAGKLRTGTGWIEVAAARDLRLLDPDQPDQVAAYGLDPQNVFGPVISTAGTLQAAAADSRFTRGGGSIRVDVGNDVIGPATQRTYVNDWLRRTTASSQDDADRLAARGASWWVEGSEFRNGIGTLGGGDVRVTAGRDITDMNLAVPTSGRAVSATVLDVQGGGDLTVSAGRNVLGTSVVVGLGDGRVNAGGRLDSTAGNNLSVFLMGQNGDGTSRTARVTAVSGGPANVTNISNPTILALSGVRDFDRPGYQNFQPAFFTYSPTASASVIALSGDLTLNGYLPPIRDVAVSQLGVISSSEFLPPRVVLASLQGELRANNPFSADVRPLYLYPSGQRDVRLLADRDISRIGVRAVNAVSAQLPQWNVLDGIAPSIVEAGGVFEAKDIPFGPASATQITAPAQPGGLDFAIESRSGSIFESSFRLPAASLVRASRDIENVRLDLQNLAESDVTRIEAGRDFRYPGTLRNGQTISVDRLRIGGPGALVIQVGRNLSFGNVSGLTAAGNTLNPQLASDTSARIVLAAGVTKPVDLAGVDTLMETLKRAGIDGTIAIADQAIGNLFGPLAAGRGDINTFFSSITTLGGSGVDLLAPKGDVNAGLTVNRPDVGFITYRGGAVRSYLSGDFNVNLAKVLTVRGGDILLYTSGGNIDAGRGALTSRTTTPPRVLRDSSGNIIGFDAGSDAAGSGIRTLTSDPDGAGPLLPPPAGTVYLFAPSGIVNAGEAGIASGGDLFIRAVAVVNAANISAAGSSVGVPVASVGLSAGLAGASAVAGAATKAAEDATRDNAQRTAANATQDAFRPSFITVEVLGFGN